MPISFLIQSKKNPAPIYIRVTEGKDIDTKVRTKYVVDPSRFSKNTIRNFSIPKSADATIKARIIKNNQDLSILRNNLENLRGKVSTLLNQRESNETINAGWLRNVLNPINESNKLPNDLISFFEDYHEFKNDSLKKGTIKNNNVVKSRVIEFQKNFGILTIDKVNKKFSLAFQKWCRNKGYDHNTMFKSLKTIKMICRHAKDRGATTSYELDSITKGLRYKYVEPVFLTFDEINRIIEKPMLSERLEIAKDWLIISCDTAARVSDFMRFTVDKIVEMEGIRFIDITQVKTDSQVLIPITPAVANILKKRNNQFPPLFSENEQSNQAMYNRLIKKVCRKAGINEIVTAKIRNTETNRYEIKEIEKHLAVSSHIGRRSYATNYYGKIPTPLLISATGHSSEAQFLRYVRKKGTHNALALAKAMRALSMQNGQKPRLELIKNIAIK